KPWFAVSTRWFLKSFANKVGVGEFLVSPKQPTKKETIMSNQVGDRYTCTDPDCGCEIEIKTPSRTADESIGYAAESAARVTGASESGYPTRTSEVGTSGGSVSTPGDFGSQGATGEGVFGSSGTGTESATRSDQRRISMSSSESTEASEDLASMNSAPICFCGKRMTQSESRSQSVRTARI